MRTQQVLDRVELIKPALAGLDPDIQGAILADLTSIWLAGHPPQYRADILALQMEYIKSLVPVNDRIFFGEAGHPAAFSE